MTNALKQILNAFMRMIRSLGFDSISAHSVARLRVSTALTNKCESIFGMPPANDTLATRSPLDLGTSHWQLRKKLTGCWCVWKGSDGRFWAQG
jgi:hypothetical protein